MKTRGLHRFVIGREVFHACKQREIGERIAVQAGIGKRRNIFSVPRLFGGPSVLYGGSKHAQHAFVFVHRIAVVHFSVYVYRADQAQSAAVFQTAYDRFGAGKLDGFSARRSHTVRRLMRKRGINVLFGNVNFFRVRHERRGVLHFERIVIDRGKHGVARFPPFIGYDDFVHGYGREGVCRSRVRKKGLFVAEIERAVSVALRLKIRDEQQLVFDKAGRNVVARNVNASRFRRRSARQIDADHHGVEHAVGIAVTWRYDERARRVCVQIELAFIPVAQKAHALFGDDGERSAFLRRHARDRVNVEPITVTNGRQIVDFRVAALEKIAFDHALRLVVRHFLIAIGGFRSRRYGVLSCRAESLEHAEEFFDRIGENLEIIMIDTRFFMNSV